MCRFLRSFWRFQDGFWRQNKHNFAFVYILSHKIMYFCRQLVIAINTLLLIMDENELKLLIGKMKTGDRDSFNQIFRRYYTPLVRFCVRFVADGDQSAEIVQDLFVKLWTNRERLTFNTSFESYMLRSVRNAAITHITKERAHAETNERIYVGESDTNDPSETLQSNNLEASYRKVLASMPEKRRDVFLASRFDGLKYTEIADKFGMSTKTVEAHMSAAIKQLREGLKEYLWVSTSATAKIFQPVEIFVKKCKIFHFWLRVKPKLWV